MLRSHLIGSKKHSTLAHSNSSGNLSVTKGTRWYSQFYDELIQLMFSRTASLQIPTSNHELSIIQPSLIDVLFAIKKFSVSVTPKSNSGFNFSSSFSKFKVFCIFPKSVNSWSEEYSSLHMLDYFCALLRLYVDNLSILPEAIKSFNTSTSSGMTATNSSALDIGRRAV